MTASIFIGIASFLGGSLLTVLIFVVPLVGKLSTLTERVEALSKQLDKMERDRPICSYHSMLSDNSGRSEERIKALEETVRRLGS